MTRDIVAAIRDAVPGLLIATRLNVFDGIPYRRQGRTDRGVPCATAAPLVDGWGTDLTDPLPPDLTEPLAAGSASMATLGVALVNVSMGNPYAIAAPHPAVRVPAAGRLRDARAPARSASIATSA